MRNACISMYYYLQNETYSLQAQASTRNRGTGLQTNVLKQVNGREQASKRIVGPSFESNFSPILPLIYSFQENFQRETPTLHIFESSLKRDQECLKLYIIMILDPISSSLFWLLFWENILF